MSNEIEKREQAEENRICSEAADIVRELIGNDIAVNATMSGDRIVAEIFPNEKNPIGCASEFSLEWDGHIRIGHGSMGLVSAKDNPDYVRSYLIMGELCRHFIELENRLKKIDRSAYEAIERERIEKENNERKVEFAKAKAHRAKIDKVEKSIKWSKEKGSEIYNWLDWYITARKEKGEKIWTVMRGEKIITECSALQFAKRFVATTIYEESIEEKNSAGENSEEKNISEVK